MSRGERRRKVSYLRAATFNGKSGDPLKPPANVSVGSGLRSATFSVSTSSSLTTIPATLSAETDDSVATAVINVLRKRGTQRRVIPLQNVSCSSTSLSVGERTVCSLQLGKPAPLGGSSALITANTSGLEFPSSVQVPAGSLAAVFTAVASAIRTTKAITISAKGSPDFPLKVAALR